MAWFRVLALTPDLATVRANLAAKIRKTTIDSVLGCVQVTDPKTRPVMDKKDLARFKEFASDAPERYELYHIALLRDQKVMPLFDPPPYPEKLRKSTNFKEGQEATWVASHLCHDKKCVNTAHIVWEPSWMNRLRDNCPGGEECKHGPDQCLRKHRYNEDEIVDWTAYLTDDQKALYGNPHQDVGDIGGDDEDYGDDEEYCKALIEAETLVPENPFGSL